MELRIHKAKTEEIIIAPIGDIQWSGEDGPTAKDHLRRHIDKALKLGAYFIGMGDYIDFLSPSNRQRLRAAGLYDTAGKVIWDRAVALAGEVFYNFLEPTRGRWLGMLEGHHFSEEQGDTTDTILADWLNAPFLGTSCMVKLEPSGKVLYAHHGVGSGVMPAAGLNKLYHTSHGWGADVFLMGHNTKLAASKLSRPYPVWGKRDSEHRLEHNDLVLVNTGGWSKSSIVGQTNGKFPRGDYAEAKMLTPSPLNAPLLYISKRGIDVRL